MAVSEIQSKESIFNDLARRREPFREIIERFGLLACRQADLRAELPLLDINTSAYDEDRFLEGEPLIMFVDPGVFGSILSQAASRIWPVLGITFPALREALAALECKLADNALLESCLRAVVHGDGKALEQGAALAGVTPDFLLMALRAAYAPCIAAQKETLLAQAPATLWRKSYCPVCGSDPDLATLENHPDPSEFLVSKSGEIWHHCPVCSHRWRFVRMVCPGCGNQDHEQMSRLTASESSHEHIYVCDQCHQYLPCLDLVEKCDPIDLDLAALGLVHLDAVAQSRGYAPLSPAPWTALGLGADQAKAS
ncbi:MAG: formate dehydrogenase accessory protein FdhE [Deltaproteobacteria bacterium]|nr:formate dehydrogenase accessory protein FdhE [Deltaproteobacteria bacterium]